MSFEGLEAFDALTDQVIPRRKIVQPTTTTDIDNAMPGTFIDETNKTFVGKTMRAIMVKMVKGRVLYHPMDSGKKGVWCASDDTLRPASNIKEPVSDSCLSCSQAKYDLYYDMLFYDVTASKEYGAPVLFWLRAAKTSVPPAKVFMSGLVQAKKRAFDAVVTIGAGKSNNAKGNFFVLSFTNIDPTPADLLPELEATYEIYGAPAATETDEDIFS